MNFNLDSKRIGIYTKVNLDYKEANKTDNTFLFICIISILVVLIGVLLFILIRIYFYKPRKKRANELLDDDFEYKTNENQDNKIVPDDENK